MTALWFLIHRLESLSEGEAVRNLIIDSARAEGWVDPLAGEQSLIGRYDEQLREKDRTPDSRQ